MTTKHKSIEEAHKAFKEEFGIHFKNSPSELELVGGFLEDFATDIQRAEREKEMRYEDLMLTDEYAYLLLHRAFELHGLDVKIGDEVILTQWGRQNGISKKTDKGIVKGFGKGSTLRVQPKGLKGTYTYWSGFWRKKNHPILEQFYSPTTPLKDNNPTPQ